MTEISTQVTLRPTRIGFLVNPYDMDSVRRIMQICTCLWGGVYNPIIPVFDEPHPYWQAINGDPVSGLEVAKGYIKFFEPDVYVEAEEGLIEKAGLPDFKGDMRFDRLAVSLKDFLHTDNYKKYTEPVYGLNIINIINSIYETEQRFVLKDQDPAIIVNQEENSGVTEVLFGCYPSDDNAAYISNHYQEVFKPTILSANPESWLKVFDENAEIPLGVTKRKIKNQWINDGIIFVFDPTKSEDLIELWNLRLQPYALLPVPLQWLEGLKDFLIKAILMNYQPYTQELYKRGSYTLISFSRSINDDQFNDLIKQFEGLPQGSLIIKGRTPEIWNQLQLKTKRLKRKTVVSKEERSILVVKDEINGFATFKSLNPELLRLNSFNSHTWINALRMSGNFQDGIATVFPFNQFDPTYPNLDFSSPVLISSEGCVFFQWFESKEESIKVLKPQAVIIDSLRIKGITARLSEPGDIAKQMLHHLGGLWAVNLIADLEILNLLNNMACSKRVRNNVEETAEETFPDRTKSLKEWQSCISRLNQNTWKRKINLATFTEKNIIKLGLKTDCSFCHFENWHSLSYVDYELVCERCLKKYPFPQGDIKRDSQNWFYRVIGPFSVPDFGRGAYSSLLTLRFIDRLGSYSDKQMIHSTAINLEFDGIRAEVDFAALYRNESMDNHQEPFFIIGECKSMGNGNLITPKDTEQLKKVADKIPDTVIVISVLREYYTDEEKILLKDFATWCRRKNEFDQPFHPLILLTSHELLMDYSLDMTWKKLGEPYQSSIPRMHLDDFYELSDATLKIHLGLPSFQEELFNC